MSDSVLHGRVLEESASWQQRAETAEKALAEARKDTERMDWMSARFVVVSPSGKEGEPPTHWIVDDIDVPEFAGTGDTLRAAIDAAKEGK